MKLFMVEDAVFAAKRGQRPPEMPVDDVGTPNCKELRGGASMQEGLKLKACRVCSAERGLSPEELTEGVEMASMVDLVDWVVISDTTVFC